MSDYFERVESQLLDAVERHAAGYGSAGGRVPRVRISRFVLVVNAAVIVAVAVVLVAVLGRRGETHHRPPVLPSAPPRSFPGRPGNVSLPVTYGPTEAQLLNNFGVLRRPQTVADQSEAVNVACGCRLRHMRLAGTLPGGERLFVGIQDSRTSGLLNGTNGAQLSYFVMERHGDSFGSSWSFGFYDTLPEEVPGTVYVSLVPDEVASATWTFSCRGTRGRCAGMRPRTVTVPVIANVAAARVGFTTCASPVTVPPSERGHRRYMIAAMTNCLAPSATTWHAADGRAIASFPRGYGNLPAPPFVKGARAIRHLRVLTASGLGPAQLGELISTATHAVTSVLGPMSFTQQFGSDSACGLQRSVWTSPTTATPLTIFARAGRFVGYQYGVPVDQIGLSSGPGATLATSDGLTIGDTYAAARRIYGTAFTARVTPGRPNNNEVWKDGALAGALVPGIYPVVRVTDQARVATITSGQTSCGS